MDCQGIGCIVIHDRADIGRDLEGIRKVADDACTDNSLTTNTGNAMVDHIVNCSIILFRSKFLCSRRKFAHIFDRGNKRLLDSIRQGGELSELGQVSGRSNVDPLAIRGVIIEPRRLTSWVVIRNSPSRPRHYVLSLLRGLLGKALDVVIKSVLIPYDA